MDYVLATLIGFLCGGVAIFAIVDSARRRVAQEQAALGQERTQLEAWSIQLQTQSRELEASQASFKTTAETYNRAIADFNSRSISYADLQAESIIVKRDLRNLNLYIRKQ